MAKSRSRQKTKAKHTLIKVIAVLLVLVAAAYVVTSLVTKQWNPVKWVNVDEVSKEQQQNKSDVIAVTSDGKKLLTTNSYAMPRAMTFVAKQSTYSKSKEFNVTATLSNKYINGKFDWAVSFVNPSSTWATGKTAEYYVKAEPTADGSATATIKYISTFSEQIQITATLRGSGSSDTCTVDCLKNAEMYSCWVDTWDFGENISGGCELKILEGTALADYQTKYAYYGIDPNFVNAVQSYLKFDINFQAFSITEFVNNKSLAIEEQSENRLQLSFNAERSLTYADFIENFEAFDDEHKAAVYYAWYHAASDFSSRNETYVQFEFGVEAYVNGVNTTKFFAYEESSEISGELLGKDVQPSVTLNQNVVF